MKIPVIVIRARRAFRLLALPIIRLVILGAQDHLKRAVWFGVAVPLCPIGILGRVVSSVNFRPPQCIQPEIYTITFVQIRFMQAPKPQW